MTMREVNERLKLEILALEELRIQAMVRRDLRALDSLLSTTKRKGTGLGLAIVRRVVETHRGQLKIRSAPGQGTTMMIRLPL